MNWSNQQTRIAIVWAVVASLSVVGCQSAAFKKPDLSKLAFWKQEDGSTLPPPPARHFDPARVESDAGSRVADLGRSNRDPLDELEIATPRPQDSAIRGNQSGSKSPNRYSADFGKSDSAYGTDSGSSKSFDLNVSRISTSDDQGSSEVELSGSRDDFLSAMESTVSTAGAEIGTRVAQTRDEVSRQFQSNRDQVVDRSKQFVNDAADAANQQVDQFSGKLQDRMNTATNRVNDFQGSARDRIGRVSEKANEIVNRPFDALDTSRLSTQPASDPELQRMKEELLAARRDYDKLKQSIAQGQAQAEQEMRQARDSQTHSPLSPISPPDSRESNQPADTVYGSLAPAAQPPAQPATKSSSPTSDRSFPATGFGSFGSGSEMGFKPTAPKSAPIQLASGQESSSSPSNVAQQAGALMPINPAEINRASRIENHVDDVMLPESILTGNSSYAPGSVNALKRR